MLLLNVESLEITNFTGRDIPPYAILSHTWRGDHEVTLEEMRCYKLPADKAAFAFAILGREPRDLLTLSGFAKILAAAEQAHADGIEWLWVDTCCIDKRSSAELSEAINSMYAWYSRADICYAFLDDVAGQSICSEPDEANVGRLQQLGLGDDAGEFGRSRWFNRGWTLQELLAPSRVDFFDKDWKRLGSRRELASEISTASRIPEDALLGSLFDDIQRSATDVMGISPQHDPARRRCLCPIGNLWHQYAVAVRRRRAGL